jgi:spore germination protein GerM
MIIALLCTLGACAGKKRELISPVNFYYRSTSDSYGTQTDVICFEQRESFGHEEDYAYLINSYLQGPTTEKQVSPFPAGTTLVSLDLVKDKVIVVLSSHISLLSGAELSIACTCLAKTLHEMTGMKGVQISSQGDLLDGMEFITIGIDDYDLVDSFTPTEATTPDQ